MTNSPRCDRARRSGLDQPPVLVASHFPLERGWRSAQFLLFATLFATLGKWKCIGHLERQRRGLGEAADAQAEFLTHRRCLRPRSSQKDLQFHEPP